MGEILAGGRWWGDERGGEKLALLLTFAVARISSFFEAILPNYLETLRIFSQRMRAAIEKAYNQVLRLQFLLNRIKKFGERRQNLVYTVLSNDAFSFV